MLQLINQVYPRHHPCNAEGPCKRGIGYGPLSYGRLANVSIVDGVGKLGLRVASSETSATTTAGLALFALGSFLLGL